MTPGNELVGKNVIIIDVLRAGNSIIAALNNGAREIIPINEINLAWEIKKKYPNYILAGERNAQKINGFDLSNSPLEYNKKTIFNQGIIMSTTNCSRAIIKASQARLILIATLGNSEAITSFLLKNLSEINIICAGTRGSCSLEDSLAAGKIIDTIISSAPKIVLNDYAHLCLSVYQKYKNNILEIISVGANGERLKNLGMIADLEYCSLINITNIIPIMNTKGAIIKK